MSFECSRQTLVKQTGLPYTGPCARAKDAELIGAVDIGGTKIATAIVSADGRIAESSEWPSCSLGPPAAVERMAEFFESAGAQVRGIGVGCTGPVDPFTGVIGNVDLLPGWEGVELTRALSDRCGVSVAMENDADAAALAELAWGAGRGASRFLYVTISTGIGVGAVIDGHLYRGAGGAHPEGGHHTIDPSGPSCYCGSKGCWESLASGPAMAAWAGENGMGEITTREICDLARRGDGMALRAVDRQSEYLGIGLANLATLFCPDVIALGGGVMKSSDLFLERARAMVLSRCGLIPTDRLQIVPAALGTDAALLGAAAVWLSRFSESEWISSAT